MSPGERNRALFGLLCRLVLAGVFIYSGAAKAVDPAAFALQIRAYDLLSDPWPALLAVGLPWLELLTGAALLYRPWSGGAALVASGMCVAFMAAIASAWIRGLDIACGCFGIADATGNYGWHLLFDLLLLGCAGVVLAHAVREPQRIPVPAATQTAIP